MKRFSIGLDTIFLESSAILLVLVQCPATEDLRTRTEVHKRRFLEQMQEQRCHKKQNKQGKTRAENYLTVQRMRLVMLDLVKASG